MKGERIGNIRIVDELGQGGMGTVYVGFDEALQRRVAVKAIRAEHRMTPSTKERFKLEARVLSQLDHPHICRIYDYIEDGTSEYLVLELIEGESLHALVQHGRLDRRRALEVAAQVAEALRAAHAKGIVHRDLKPDNVMLGHDGVARVLDFGLARSVPAVVAEEEAQAESGDPRGAPPEDATPSAILASGATVAGSILGTPEYMSPEQARAEEVTTASDMYSFGLMLQHLLTGRSPYPPGLNLLDVVMVAAAGESEAPEDLPTDETALIQSLKSLAPAARPTAVQTLDRLRWILDTPRRRRRRLLIAAAVVFALLSALKYTVDLRHEREIADQRRNQAENLIGFMLGDLREKLTAVGKLEILDDIGSEALAYFATVPEGELSDDELARRATALYQIGEVRIELADLESATEAFRESLRQSEHLIERDPNHTEWLATLGNCHFWVGTGHLRAGELRDALASYEAYRGIARRLAELEPDDLDWRMEVAHGEGNVSHVLQALGENERALAALMARTEIMEELVARDPARDDWSDELATTRFMTGIVSEALGEVSAALEHYRSALRIIAGLVDDGRGSPARQEQLATIQSYAGGALEQLGRLAEAGDAMQRCLELARDLVERDPANAHWRDLLATAHGSLASLARRAGKADVAREHLDLAMATYAELAEADPSRARWRLRLAKYHTERGRLLAGGDAPAALAESEVALQLLDDLAEDEVEDPSTLGLLAECLLVRGDTLRALNQVDDARRSWQRAAEALEVSGAESRNGRLLIPLVLALERLDRNDEAGLLRERLAEFEVVDERLEAEPGGS